MNDDAEPNAEPAGASTDPGHAVPFDEQEWQRIEEEEVIAEQRRSAIEAGRRKGGIAGAAMAGAMLALSEIYEGPKKDEMVAVSESPGDPGDIDTDGIEMTIGDVDLKSELPDASDDSSTA
jgi:hypothetical protein